MLSSCRQLRTCTFFGAVIAAQSSIMVPLQLVVITLSIAGTLSVAQNDQCEPIKNPVTIDEQISNDNTHSDLYNNALLETSTLPSAFEVNVISNNNNHCENTLSTAALSKLHQNHDKMMPDEPSNHHPIDSDIAPSNFHNLDNKFHGKVSNFLPPSQHKSSLDNKNIRETATQSHSTESNQPLSCQNLDLPQQQGRSFPEKTSVDYCERSKNFLSTSSQESFRHFIDPSGRLSYSHNDADDELNPFTSTSQKALKSRTSLPIDTKLSSSPSSVQSSQKCLSKSPIQPSASFSNTGDNDDVDNEQGSPPYIKQTSNNSNSRFAANYRSRQPPVASYFRPRDRTGRCQNVMHSPVRHPPWGGYNSSDDRAPAAINRGHVFGAWITVGRQIGSTFSHIFSAIMVSLDFFIGTNNHFEPEHYVWAVVSLVAALIITGNLQTLLLICLSLFCAYRFL